MTFWRELKEQLGDWFFSRELDETHDRALRYGIEQATKTLSFHLELQKGKIKMTPTERKGYEKAQQVFADTRIRLASHTGADL
jgi:hypothetical protein